MKVVDKLWTDHLKHSPEEYYDFIGELVAGALEIYNKFIAPIVKWFVENLPQYKYSIIHHRGIW